jgi:hypothetical protein
MLVATMVSGPSTKPADLHPVAWLVLKLGGVHHLGGSAETTKTAK